MGCVSLSSTALQEYSRIRNPKLQDFERTVATRLGPCAPCKHLTDTPPSPGLSTLKEVAFGESQTHCKTNQITPVKQTGAGFAESLKTPVLPRRQKKKGTMASLVREMAIKPGPTLILLLGSSQTAEQVPR